MVERISAATARRIALAATGFGRPAPAPGTRGINTAIERLQLLQIDSVNVFERSHYLPLFARIGSYDKGLLDRQTMRARTRYLEYWAHEAAFIPQADLGLFAFRMQRFRERYGEWLAERAGLVTELVSELADRGPLAASDIEHEQNVRRGPWWGWGDVKTALELLFGQGDLVSAGRKGFERRYALPAQVYPEGPPASVDRSAAMLELTRRGAIASGIGTAADFADYYRIPVAAATAAVRTLEESGELVPVAVEGWMRGDRAVPAWRHAAARIPRRIDAAAVLSPFDPVVWFRPRALRMFGFHYRISIYTPAAQRTHGYYVLPVLVGDRLVGRIDLKSDRAAGVLLVQHAWLEDGTTPDVAERIAPVLRAAAEWHGLSAVHVVGRGDLAPALDAVLRAA